jgi:hypothetical protein
MEEGHTPLGRPVALCALVCGRMRGKPRLWGFWSRLRWYLLG